MPGKQLGERGGGGGSPSCRLCSMGSAWCWVGAFEREHPHEHEMPPGSEVLGRNPLECASRPTSGGAGGEVARGRACAEMGPSGGRGWAVGSKCARLSAGQGALRARRGLVLSLELIWVWGRPPPPPPRGRPGLCFPPWPLPRRGSRFSRCFYDYIVCVGGSDVGVARERAVPGRSFINVTHIMILSAASY